MSVQKEEKQGGVRAAFLLPTTPTAVTASPQGKKRTQHHTRGWLLYLCVFELGYLLLFALSSFPGLHLYATPIAAAWSWTLLPSRMLLPLFGPLISMPANREWFSPLLLGITLLMLTGTYACTIV